MARPASAESELDDMAECSICTEVFTDPRVLPCIHTFCLKCLLNYGKDRQPGDTMPCPLCRNEFTIPDDGLAGIQKNFFMEKLLRVRNLSAGKEAQHIPCDACCSDEASTDESGKPATMHCVQCQQNYCDQCSQIHKRVKATANHTQTEIGKLAKKDKFATKLPAVPAVTCRIHEGEEVKEFCVKCKLPVCRTCCLKSHKQHKRSSIATVADELHSQLTGNTGKVTDNMKKTKKLLLSVEKGKNDLASKLADIESEINKAADGLIDAIQRDRKKLLSKVESIRQKQVGELETVKEKLEQHMAALESFKRYTETLLSSGTACDVARSAKSLHDRADELGKFDVMSHVQNSLERVNVITFASSSAISGTDGNLLGDISEGEKFTPTVTDIMPRGLPVGGVTSLGDNVYVVCSGFQRVEVYDTWCFISQHTIEVPELGVESQPHTVGLAACARNECLYLSDSYDSNIHRVELLEGNDVIKWSVAGGPTGLSVNSAGNVLVAIKGERKLQEFTTRGDLVRNILLHPDVHGPWHVVQMSTGKFLVSHRARFTHRVCMVDAKGAVVRSWGGRPGSGMANLKRPGTLALDKHGNVLVADMANNRLLVLDQSLSNAHEMSVSVVGGLQWPWSLHYDKSGRRLYIGEWGGGRIIVIENLDDFSASAVQQGSSIIFYAGSEGLMPWRW